MIDGSELKAAATFAVLLRDRALSEPRYCGHARVVSRQDLEAVLRGEPRPCPTCVEEATRELERYLDDTARALVAVR